MNEGGTGLHILYFCNPILQDGVMKLQKTDFSPEFLNPSLRTEHLSGIKIKCLKIFNILSGTLINLAFWLSLIYFYLMT